MGVSLSNYSIPDPQGLWLNEATVVSAALSAAGGAGSTHYLLNDSYYAIWASAEFRLFVTVTGAGGDPVALPSTYTFSNWPGAVVPANMIFTFQFDSSVATSRQPTPTGVRVYQNGATAGTFYLHELRRRVK